MAHTKIRVTQTPGGLLGRGEPVGGALHEPPAVTYPSHAEAMATLRTGGSAVLATQVTPSMSPPRIPARGAITAS